MTFVLPGVLAQHESQSLLAIARTIMQATSMPNQIEMSSGVSSANCQLVN
jgi:hypothetical protein